jgi:hypothetical protein
MEDAEDERGRVPKCRRRELERGTGTVDGNDFQKGKCIDGLTRFWKLERKWASWRESRLEAW